MRGSHDVGGGIFKLVTLVMMVASLSIFLGQAKHLLGTIDNDLVGPRLTSLILMFYFFCWYVGVTHVSGARFHLLEWKDGARGTRP